MSNAPVVQVREDGHSVEFIHRQLIFRIEGAQGCNDVTKKLNPVRVIIGIGKYIHNTSANCILPGTDHKISPFEMLFIKKVDQLIHIELIILFNLKSTLRKKGTRDQFFGQCLRETDDDPC